MSTKINIDNENIGLLVVRNIYKLKRHGYEIIRTFPGEDDCITVKAKIPIHISRNELDEDENIVSYQVYPSRH